MLKVDNMSKNRDVLLQGKPLPRAQLKHTRSLSAQLISCRDNPSDTYVLST